MALMDTIIITPWVAAADDPDPESPSNHPQLADDYRHQVDVQTVLVEEKPTQEGAIAAAQAAGPLFRQQFGLRAQVGDYGMGVRAPVAKWEQIKAEASANKVPVNPWLMGPSNDPTEDQFEVFKMFVDAIVEGIRLWEDKTGQQTSQLIPQPNQYSIRAVMEESVLQLVEDDNTYWYLTGFTVQPDDPEDPPIPESPLSLPPADQMTQQRYDDYIAWQEANGAPDGFMEMLLAVYAEETPPTNGEAAGQTIAWQRNLNNVAPSWVPPTWAEVDEVMKKLRFPVPV